MTFRLTEQETALIRRDMRRAKCAVVPYWNFKVFCIGPESKLAPHECLVSYKELIEITGKKDAHPSISGLPYVVDGTNALFACLGVGAQWICQHYPDIGARLIVQRLLA